MRAAAISAMMCLLLVFGGRAGAEAKEGTEPHGASYAALLQQARMGPQKIGLREQAILNLPEGFAFLPEMQAKAFMKRLGNETDENFLGIVLPAKRDTWFAFLEYIPSGYIKDDDAKTWNADELLRNVRQNTEAANAQRQSMGIPPLEIIGWVEKPHYDSVSRRLVWSISARHKGSHDPGRDIINYRTLALGRQGYVSMVLVTNLGAIGAQKSIANLLISRLDFNTGKRYGDFNASTDRVAEYGLAALIGGIVVHKLGLFAIVAAFLLKSVKLIGVLIVAALAGLRRFFGRKKPTNAEPNLLSPTPAPHADPGPK